MSLNGGVNMKVIKHGKAYISKMKKYKFKCKWCECEFVCRGYSINLYLKAFNNEPCFEAYCPECRKRTESNELKDE